ncbi:Chromo/chromo shadow domain,Pre-SET domain,Chromo domain-like,SET domain [Cinara cedri]|uniref:Chromo/chromo shadow domain,Pre-SET domain,Chromo domain-like,SET domain n=1 Tax=Cinara cedri TaxID=506608 RepID=A0A5E4MHX9_9HEMI|nr:Chromo/chromo shadow domain,Pre-SET domain,Chromo domain-like,SET domain [Cinara cedri]
MSDTSEKLQEQEVMNLDFTEVAQSLHEPNSSQVTNNIEPEDHSQTSCTAKRYKLDKNIEASTSIVTLHSIHTSGTKESNDIDSEEETIEQIDNGISEPLHDTAILIMSVVLKDIDHALYNFILSDKRALKYILSGKVLNLETEMTDYQKDNPYDLKEIDEIVDHVIIFGVRFYLVKWKNWSKGFCTWECFNDICNSQHLLGDNVKDKTNDSKQLRKIDGMHIILSRRFVSKMFNLFRTEDGLALPTISIEDLSGLFDNINIGCEMRQMAFKRNLDSYLGVISLNCFQYIQSNELKQWEITINVLSNSYNIKVENNMDLEGPPDTIVYATKYIYGKNVNISNDLVIGCECTDNCKNSTKCCNERVGYSRLYDSNKCIIVDPGYPIFECNKNCKCNTDCYNRVVQLGSTVRISIYKTEKCGWGVKASEYIEKGRFIALYTGKIITIEESKTRLKENASLSEYMWNLDFDDKHNYEYIIDGSKYANFTRFINHSCNSNLNVYTVRINCLDKTLPELALFASKNILTGEQLTVNYFFGSNKNKIGKKTGIRCLCNEKNCQGYYF